MAGTANDDSGPYPFSDQLLEEASTWLAMMRSGSADIFRGAFERWMAQDAAHATAYERAGEIYALQSFLASESRRNRR